MSQTEDYWDEPKPHSIKKSRIVADYIVPWAAIIGSGCDELHYLDLFSGRGIYRNGMPATPMYVLDQMKSHPDIARKMRMTFCEEDGELRDVLTRAIEEHPAYGLLKDKPVILQDKITPSYAECLLGQVKEGTFTFVDPFGYCDISLDLLDVVTSEWGCDSLFYVSISGIVRNLKQPEKWPKLKSFFGALPFHDLMEKVDIAGGDCDLCDVIFGEIEQVLHSKRDYHLLKYTVEFEDRKTESHYLVFITKHPRGIEKMLQTMARHGQKDGFGLTELVYSPRRESENAQLCMVVSPGDSLGKLAARLARDFSGQRIIVDSVLSACLERGYCYLPKDLRKGMDQLRQEGKLTVISARNSHAERELHKGTVIQFAQL